MNARSSLISRLAGSTAILAAAAVVLAIVFFVVIHSVFFDGIVVRTLNGFSTTLAERVLESPHLASEAARRHDVGIVMDTAEGQVAFHAGGEEIDPEVLISNARHFRRIDVEGHGGQRISFYWDRDAHVQQTLVSLAGLVGGLLLIIGVTYVFQLNQLRPLRWLRTGVDAVSEGNFNVTVPVVRQDEIGQIAQAFNQMTRRIEQMINDRERLLGDVSHELRSPLARMKVALELMPESDKRQLIAKDIREMESLITVLLERERVRSRTERLDSSSVDIVALSREIVAEFEGRAPGIEVVEALGDAIVQADSALMRVLLHNLIDNALKFSLSDSRPVQVGVTTSAEYAELSVRDDGPGIPSNEITRVFEPFVKLDPARGHRTGYGLGLNLCKRIVEAHGGSIELSKRTPRGTQVLVRIPIQQG